MRVPYPLRRLQRVGILSLPMPHGLKRYSGRGDFHFITFSCYERRPFLHGDQAKRYFLKILGEVRTQTGFRLAGYVVMPEHVHLLLDEPPATTPARIIQILKQRVSRTLRVSKCSSASNLKRFWQRRYYDFNVYSEEKLREKLEYMHLNPVKRGLVGHPRDWLWSSWSCYECGGGLLPVDKWS
jgi:REP-associated tyrosine transposase